MTNLGYIVSHKKGGATLKFDKAKMRLLRRCAEMSQGSLAKMVGVSRATIVSWESGISIPTVEQIGKIGECLAVTGKDLIVEEVAC